MAIWRNPVALTITSKIMNRRLSSEKKTVSHFENRQCIILQINKNKINPNVSTLKTMMEHVIMP